MCTDRCKYLDVNIVGPTTDLNLFSYETTDCQPDEVIDRNGLCQQCDELNLGCSVCSDSFINDHYDGFIKDTPLNKCVECEANIQVLFEDKKTEVTYVHKYPPNWAYEWWQQSCRYIDC